MRTRDKWSVIMSRMPVLPTAASARSRLKLLGAASLFLISVATFAQKPTIRTVGGEVVVDKSARESALAERRKYEPYVDGVLVRRVLETAPETKSELGYGVEVWGLVMGPGRHANAIDFPGAAILLVRSGRGIAQVRTATQARKDLDGEPRELIIGTSLVVPEDGRVALSNTDAERPLILRVVLIRGDSE